MAEKSAKASKRESNLMVEKLSKTKSRDTRPACIAPIIWGDSLLALAFWAYKVMKIILTSIKSVERKTLTLLVVFCQLHISTKHEPSGNKTPLNMVTQNPLPREAPG